MNFYLVHARSVTEKALRSLFLLALTLSTANAGLFTSNKTSQEESKQYPEVPDILEVYYMALENDNQLAAAKLRHNAEKEVRSQARSALLPKANINAFTRINDNVVDSDTLFISPESHYNENGFTLILSQPLFNAPALLGLPEANLLEKKADLIFLEQEQALIAKVADIYIGLIIAQSNLSVVETQEKAIEELLQQARLNFDLGTATISDTHEAQAARDIVHAQALAVKIKLKNIRHELYTLTGQHIEDVIKFESHLPLEIEKFKIPPLHELEEVALKANIRLNLKRIDHALAKIKFRKSQAGRLPKIDLIATVGENNANGSAFGTKSDAEFYTIGAELNMPLLAGGGLNSRIRQTRLQYKELEELLKNTEKQTLLTLNEAYLNAELALSSLKAFRKAEASARLSLQSIKLGFDLGERTSLDVLSAQQTYYQAVRDYTESQYNYLLATLGINLSLGLVSEKDIMFIAKLAEQVNSGKYLND